ncbi:MAG TPA: patatin-like phospholipase family protein [Rectinemataceae bacterium]|nr:patatin-like phospholipase family protein [Rectinemataceae bacterium]
MIGLRRSLGAGLLAAALVLPLQAAPMAAAGIAPGALSVPRPRVALVLSGGSALGMAHAGVIEVIEDMGIPIDMVLGTSMGAIVGGLYAAGYSPAEMQDIVRGIDWASLFSDRRENPGDRYRLVKDTRFPARLGFDRSGFHFGEGLLEGQNVLSFFTGLTLNLAGVEDFDKLPVPYRAVAADILTGEKVVFSRGSIAEAMRASMSIPGVFAPWEHGSHFLVDGGMVDNMPVDLARQMGADIVIAVESRVRGASSAAQLKSGVAVSAQTLELFIEENMRASRRDADILIRPDLSRYTSASFAAAPILIRKGREAALAMKPELEAIAKRVAATRALVTPDSEPNRAARRQPPLLSGLSFVGGSPEERAAAATAFVGLADRRLDSSSLQAALARVWSTGFFSLVTIDFVREPAATGAGGSGGSGPAETGGVAEGGASAGTGSQIFPEAVRGRVRLVDRMSSRNDLMVGGYWRGVFSSLGSADSRLSPALFFGNVSGKDSALFVAADLLGRSGVTAEWFQPFGPFYFRTDLEWESRYDSWSAGEGLGVRSYYREAGGRATLGLALGHEGEIESWWSLESVRASLPDDPSLGLNVNSELVDSLLGQGGARFEWSAYDRDPFPSRGFSVSLEALAADPAFGGDSYYRALDVGSGATLPLGRRASLSLEFFAGTDFSSYLPGLGELPSSEWFALAHPGIFPLLETRSARGIGNHVLASSLESRYRMGRMNALLGGDIYAIANLSAGAARITGNPAVDFLPLRWSGGLGVGARFVEHLGIEAMVGFVLDEDPLAPIRPAFSVRLGSLAEFPEDRR